MVMTNIDKLKNARYNAFKKQDLECGYFDVIFDVRGRRLYAHKCMLNPIFNTYNISTSKPIPIEAYCFEDVYRLLDFLYLGEIINATVFDMLDAAVYYQIPIFKDFCEEFLTNAKPTYYNVMHLLDLAARYSMVRLRNSLISCLWDLLKNDEPLLSLPREVFMEMIGVNKSPGVPEQIFKKLYELAEIEAMSMKKLNSNLNLTETIKAMLADFLPYFDFAKMDRLFVIKFVVAKSLLPSDAELSERMLNLCVIKSKNFLVIVTDKNGRMMTGQFCDLPDVYEDIQKLKNVNSLMPSEYWIFWITSRQYRQTQEILKKRDGIEWYLIYNYFDIAIKHRSQYFMSNDNLIAEMFAEDGFVLSRECKIEAYIV